MGRAGTRDANGQMGKSQDYLTAPGAALTAEEREWIRATCAGLADDRGDEVTMVHVGVGQGGSLHCSRAGSERGRLVGVDVDCSRLVGDPRAALIESESARAAAAWDGGEIAFLFIDADHSEAAVRADVQGWRGHIGPGGVLAFHDYGNDHLPWCVGVKRAVDAFAWDGWEEMEVPGSIRAFRLLRQAQGDSDE